MTEVMAKLGASGSPLELLGLSSGDEGTYRTVLRSSGATRERMAEITGLSLAELDAVLERLVSLGLVRIDSDVVVAEPPAEVLGQVIRGETERMQRESEGVDALRNLLPTLTSEHLAASRRRGEAVDVHAVEHADVVNLLRSLAQESSGDLLWFRPDQWRLPISDDIDQLVRELIATGRRSRAVYPAQALEQAPDVLRARAEVGEQIRIVGVVPSRLSVFGDQVALVPDRWGEATARRLVVREESLLNALQALFHNVWDRGMAVPGLELGADDADGQRRLLLLELGRGVKDEHIARTLGVSLRTVRRRIADVMDELEAESRFQAGAEAVRRGWV
jgi:hypothetical protein